ncbi:hypothetical protein M1563_02755 [Patescibacteria group bacterium]|nr:hypothetical protein [Patescibacteria group bacterium]MCL5409925.1 hypothetical protein [Patescibacteria group bacterium]
MIAQLIIQPDIPTRIQAIEKILIDQGLNRNHPNLIWFDENSKLGVEQTKKIREHLSLKPYQGKFQAAVLIAAEVLSLDAQNSLLKILEEPPGEALIILGIGFESQLLPTVISRCQLTFIHDSGTNKNEVLLKKYQAKIMQLFASNIETRFQLIEKIEQREEFLTALVTYFHEHRQDKTLQPFLADLLQASLWQQHNVNTRGILEYLMLKIPIIKDNKIEFSR